MEKDSTENIELKSALTAGANGHAERNSFATLMLDKIAMPVTYVGRDYRYKYVNSAYATWTDAETTSIIGSLVEDFLGYESFSHIKRYMDAALSGEVVQYEAEIPFKHGVCFIEATYTPDVDENGNVKGYVGLINDVTEKKRIAEKLQVKQQELKRSQEYYEKLLANLPVAIYTTDINGYIKTFNEAAVKLWGREPEPGVDLWCGSMKMLETDEVTEMPLDECPMAMALKESRPIFGKELIVERPDKSRKYIVPYPQPVHDSDGKTIGGVNIVVDVTEQKLVQKALKESEASYRELVNGLSVAVYTCDKEGNIILYNEDAVKIWGKEPVRGKDKWIGWPYVYKDGKYLSPDESPMAIAVKEGKPVYVSEVTIEKPDGKKYTILPHPRPLFNSSGEVTGGVNVLIDISNRKKVEMAFKESERRFRNLIQGLPAAFYTTDKDGYITLFNEAAVKLWGRRPVIGKDRWCGSMKIYRPDGVTEIPLDKCPMAIALKERRKVEVNEPFIVERPDGARRFFIPHPEPIFDSDGNLIGANNMLVDVTDSKLAEISKARLAAIVQSSGDAIISKTLDSIITSWNDAAERMFGYKAKEMIGQTIYKLIPMDRLDEEQLILEKIRNGELIDHFETKRVTKDGELIDISLTISPIKNTEGIIIGASKIARDITEQKLSEKIIHEKEEHLRMAIESVKLGTWEYDPVSATLSCSEESRNMCGLPVDMNPDFDLIVNHIYTEDKDFFYQQIKAAIDPDRDGRFDMQLRFYRYDDKEIRWAHAQGKVFFSPNRRPERLIGTLLDITEQKQRELQLMSSMEMFQTMADNVPAMIWMSGTDKFNDYFNRTWLEFTGRTLEQESDEGWLEGMHPDDVEKCVDTYNASLKEQEGFYCEYRLRRHDGQYRWIADNSVPRSSPDGVFLGFISACIDIDDQKRFREKIMDSELLFKTISNTSPAALWMTNQSKKNIFVSDTWLKWTGSTFDQQINRGWVSEVHKEDRERILNNFFECFDTRKDFAGEFRLPGKDGRIRWCLTEGKPYFDISGAFAGYAGSVTDITELKKLEQRKDDFIKMASHELKTPITSINGYVQLLLNIYNEAETEKLQMSRSTVRSSLGTIAKQVTKLTRLISELLDLSKIESGKLELHCQNFNLSELIEETAQDVRHTTSRHAIIVESHFEGKIYGDKDRIAQVIMNLLNNAIKYTPDSGSIEVFLEGNKKTATIRIKDYGIGIDKKYHEKIFERFYRVEGKTEQTYPGFGIGLFIASEIVHRHKGSIQVKSQKGKGSLFTISLPLDFRK